MARIRMLTSVAGDGFVWETGQVVDLPGPQAAAWADGVRAELVRDTPLETPETAPAEQTSRKTPRRKPGPRAAAGRE